MNRCGDCHYFQENHSDLPPRHRDGEHGLCVSPWRTRHAAHRESDACPHWQRREPERLLRKRCPACEKRAWKWLTECPNCGGDLEEEREPRRTVTNEWPRNHWISGELGGAA